MINSLGHIIWDRREAIIGHWWLVKNRNIYFSKILCAYIFQQVLEPRLNGIIFIDPMGNKSNRLMNRIQKNWKYVNRLYITAYYSYYSYIDTYMYVRVAM